MIFLFLIPFLIIGIPVFAVLYPMFRSAYESKPDSLLSYKFNTGGGFAALLLFLALIGLGERILYDLSRTIAGPKFDYFSDYNTILVHAGFIVLVLIITTFLSFMAAEYKKKYAVVVIPYFVFSLIMALQLILEVGVYFYWHHTAFQFYLLMVALVLVLSLAIHMIQSRYTPELQ